MRTDPDHQHYQNILSSITQEPYYITTQYEHDTLPLGSVVSTVDGYARKEDGWEFFGKEGIHQLEGNHQVLRKGHFFIPTYPTTTYGETGVIASYKYRILEFIKHSEHNAYTDFRQLLELPMGSIISTEDNDYQRFEQGWAKPGSEVFTSSQGITRYQKAYLLYKM
ncbi:MAG: hypothetical protein H9W81_07520 [Enterococcus sp.]|nr:hypothetical protein [Enterococcus sp.]